MAKNEVKETAELSKSKQKRIERQKELASAKRSKAVSKITGIVVAVVVVGIIAGAIGYNVYRSVNRTVASTDFSKGLTDEGKVDGVNALDYVTLPDYKNLVIAKSEVEATADVIENDIQTALNSHKYVSEDTEKKVVEGDTVRIDYVGSIDGVEFEGGNSNGAGYDLTIGSGQFIDGFEEQLIDHTPGEVVTVTATFPEEYENNPDLAGKEANFEVTIHGIYETPEFTDEFVKEYYGDVASTIVEYRQSIADKYYKENLNTYISNYITENTTANKYPKSYVKVLKSLLKGNDEMTISYYNQMFAQYGISYSNPWDLSEDVNNEAEYEKDLQKRAQDSCTEALAYQAIFENEGLTLDMDAYLAELTEENGEDYVNELKENGGLRYLAQNKIREMVLEHLCANANVQ